MQRKPGRPKDSALPQRRRQEILPCAVAHFATVGYHAADLDQIAADIRCAKGTLYRYFASKQELFEASVDHVMTELLESRQVRTTDDLIADMSHSIEQTLAFFDQRPMYVELLLQERAVFKDRSRPTFFEYWDTDCEEWDARVLQAMAQGLLRSDMSIADIRHIGVTLIYGTIFTQYFARHVYSYQERARQISRIFFDGIRARPTGQLQAAASQAARPRKPRPATQTPTHPVSRKPARPARPDSRKRS